MSIAGAASAADLGRRNVIPMQAPSFYVPYNWTGFYLGINGGGAWGTSDWSLISVDISGGLIGGTIGYNWQLGQFVYGLEADFDWASIRGSNSGAPCVTTCDTRNSWLGTTRARIGYAFDRFMPYITGGIAFGDVRASSAGFGTSTHDNVGWTVGGGLEGAIAGLWTAKIEYLYVDLGDNNCPAGACAPASNVDFRTNIVRAGLNYRF